MKLIQKRNPVKFLDTHINVESVPMNQYFIIDSEGYFWDRIPHLVKTEERIISLIESDLHFENNSIRLKTEEEKEIEFNENINNSFHGFKHHIFVFDQKAFLEHNIEFLKFDREVKSAQRANKAVITEKVVVMNEETQQLRTEQNVYIDYINVTEMDYIKTLKCFEDDGITERNLVEVTPNPTKVLEITV